MMILYIYIERKRECWVSMPAYISVTKCKKAQPGIMHTSSKGEWVWVCGGYSTHQPLGRYDRHVAYYNHS